MMATTPGHHAVVTEVDFDRLTRLIDSRRYRSSDAGRVFGLKTELDRRVVVSPDRIPKGAVTMNLRVRVRDLASGVAETYTLVYPDDADIDLNRVSVLAPLGMALLGRSAREVFEFTVPAGTRRMRVERVVYQPEAAGDLHL